MSLQAEIREQPAVVDRLLATQLTAARDIAATVRAAGVGWVMIAARGSSDNAALYAQYVWGGRNGLAVAMATPSLFTVYGTPPRLEGALVVGISQSGQSPDIRSVLAEAKRQGAPTLAITNEGGSPLAAEAGMVLETCAGPERSIAATKTYTSQLAAIAMLSAALREDEAGLDELQRIPEAMQRSLDGAPEIAELAWRHRAMERCVVLGRGFHYATAYEWALKLEELTYVTAEPWSAADFRHGPMAMAGRDLTVLAVAPGGAVHGDLMALLSSLVGDRGVDLVALSDVEETLALAGTPLRMPPGVPEWLSPITAIVPAQVFCYELARAMGRDTEAPRGLSKVTKTW